MSCLVLDASVALAWIFERQDAAEARCAERALEAVPTHDTLVPVLWHTEIANAVLVGERRKHVTEAQSSDFLARLTQLPFETDPTPASARREAILAIARAHRLTAYDATYLELALRTGARLASFDRALAAAMKHAGGQLLF